MAPTLEMLAEEAAGLDAAQFAEFMPRAMQERMRRGLPMDADDELIRQEDLALSQQALAKDWEGVPDNWEANRCPSSEAT